MATVHPSRMDLVPQDAKDVYPRERSPPPSHSQYRDRRGRDRARDRESDNDSGRGRRGGRERERLDDKRDRRDYDDRQTPPRPRDRGRHRERERDSRDRDRDRSGSRRRASPEYEDYKRPPSPGPGTPSMYPNRQQRESMYERRSGYGGGSSEYLESRRAQRECSTFSIWPPSPKAPARALSPERGSSRRKSRRDRSATSTESSDSEAERRHRERRERKRAQKEKGRRERKEHRRRSRSYHDTDEERRSGERGRKRRGKSESRPRSPSASPVLSSSRMSGDEGEWVEKSAAAAPFVVASQNNSSVLSSSAVPLQIKRQVDEDDHDNDDDDNDSDMDVGPQPLMKAIASKKVDERAYGSALLRGEGSAMAAFLQDDTQTRIPRRGEIGLTSDEIAQFEAAGYVMSGSRHKRMNAVRMRKENQVISAEEKRGILKLQREERERRETILREEFDELVKEKLKGPEAKRVIT